MYEKPRVVLDPVNERAQAIQTLMYARENTRKNKCELAQPERKSLTPCVNIRTAINTNAK